MDDIQENLNLDLTVNMENQVEQVGDLLYFNPLLYDAYKKNPFSLEKRQYPVEYPYPMQEKEVVFIELPDGYAVESYPQSIKYVALDNKVSYSYRFKLNGNIMILMTSLDINTPIFLSSEYPDLKTIFEKIVEKNLEKVVLKKI